MRFEDFIKHFEVITESASGTLSRDTELLSIKGWDSLAVLGLQAFVDKNFSASLNVSALMNAKTVGDVWGIINND